jgi:hypothetical protein
MDNTSSISEMQKFHFGSKISCTDGEDGILASVIFDPSSRRMTSIGVKQGRLFGKTTYLPFSSIVDATGEGITLRITRSELAAASKTEPEGARLDNKSVVEREGATGRGTLLLTAVQPESGQLAYIVAHQLRPGQYTLIRQDLITRIETGHVYVSISDADLQALPPYRPDAELQQEVESILFDLTPLHIDFKGMSVRVLDSVLYLAGNISSSLRGEIVEDQAAGVPGLLEIKNGLVGDDKLAADLAMVFGRDERTRDLPIGIYPRLGVVRLSGAVHHAQEKAIAEEIAKKFPGVRSVDNDIVIDPKADMLHVMSSSEGGEASDKVPGKYVRHTR